MTQQNSSDTPRSDIDIADTLALLAARVDHLSNELKDLRIQQTVQQNQSHEFQDQNVTQVALRLLAARSRRTRLQTAVRDFVQLLQDNEDCHVSEILEAFGDYALHESSKIPDLQPTWKMVATFLKAAATEAETRGRELP